MEVLCFQISFSGLNDDFAGVVLRYYLFRLSGCCRAISSCYRPAGLCSRGLICHHRCWMSWNRIVYSHKVSALTNRSKTSQGFWSFELIFSKNEFCWIPHIRKGRWLVWTGKWRFSKVHIFWGWVGAVLSLKWLGGEKLKINSEKNIAEQRWCFRAEDGWVSFVDYLLLKNHRISRGSFALCAASQASIFYWVHFSVRRFLQMQQMSWDTGVNLLALQPSCQPPYSDLLLQLSQKLVFCFKAVITWSEPKCDLEWAVRGFLVGFCFNSWRLQSVLWLRVTFLKPIQKWLLLKPLCVAW